MNGGRIGSMCGNFLKKAKRFTWCTGIMERSVLYIGDHIYGDILKCKKNKGWKTFLVVKELDHQIACWVKCKPLIKDLETVRRWKKHVNEFRKEKYAQMDNPDECIVSPEVNGMTRSGLSKSMKEKVQEIDLTYGKLGGLFVSGTRETFFASQVKIGLYNLEAACDAISFDFKPEITSRLTKNRSLCSIS